MALKHVLLVNPRLKGWEYGMLRALEAEIVKQTGAAVIEVPFYGLHTVTSRAGHGMRWDPVRSLLPKKSFRVEADVIWYILMGPENFELDLFKDWDINAKYRIAYIYDTLEPQFGLVQKLFSDDRFNIKVTSFHDAVPYLEALTKKKWHAIEQAIPEALFSKVPFENESIQAVGLFKSLRTEEGFLFFILRYWNFAKAIIYITIILPMMQKGQLLPKMNFTNNMHGT